MTKPNLFQFDYLHIIKLIDSLEKSIKNYLKNKKDLKIIDLGCGEKPYFSFLKEIAKEYIGIDIKKGPWVDIVASIDDIPMPDSYFDAAISTQTLEHIRNYQKAIDEIHRVLKNGGIAFVSVPGIWEIHGAPNDFWRFTKYGLQEAFSKFKKVEIINNGGPILCFFQILNIYLKKTLKIPVVNFLAMIIILINNFLGYYLDKLTGNYYDFFVINYLVIAEK